MPTKPYTCLKCGSVHGEQAPPHSESWYWWHRIDGHKVGPFCSREHMRTFLEQRAKHDGPSFTLGEWLDLLALKERYERESGNAC